MHNLPYNKFSTAPYTSTKIITGNETVQIKCRSSKKPRKTSLSSLRVGGLGTKNNRSVIERARTENRLAYIGETVVAGPEKYVSTER